MTEETRRRAEAALKDIEEVTSVVLPEPDTQPVTTTSPDPQIADEIRKRMAEIDLSDSGSVVGFGARAQSGLQEISQKMLADVKNKDVGPAGESLREVVSTIRGFSVSELDVRRSRSWWKGCWGALHPSRALSPIMKRCRPRSTALPPTLRRMNKDC